MDEGDRVVVDWMVDLGPRLSKMTALLQANDPGRQEEFALGAIRAGFLAGFIILPRDPFETDVRSIHGMVPAAAIVAGELRSGALARGGALGDRWAVFERETAGAVSSAGVPGAWSAITSSRYSASRGKTPITRTACKHFAGLAISRKPGARIAAR